MLKVSSILTLFAFSMMAEAPKPIFQSDKGIAVDGTDVVAYFTLSVPTKGKPEFSYSWNGATWLFANADHLTKFKAEPEKYAPQYGGYCSYAVSKGKTASISPKAWTIVDGKLYLNHLFAQGPWKKDIPGLITKADQNWPAVKAGK